MQKGPIELSNQGSRQIVSASGSSGIPRGGAAVGSACHAALEALPALRSLMERMSRLESVAHQRIQVGIRPEEATGFLSELQELHAERLQVEIPIRHFLEAITRDSAAPLSMFVVASAIRTTLHSAVQIDALALYLQAQSDPRLGAAHLSVPARNEQLSHLLSVSGWLSNDKLQRACIALDTRDELSLVRITGTTLCRVGEPIAARNKILRAMVPSTFATTFYIGEELAGAELPFERVLPALDAAENLFLNSVSALSGTSAKRGSAQSAVVYVSYSLHTSVAGDRYFVVEVADNGPGLSLEAQQRLRSVNPESVRTAGRGQGLSIVRDALSALGGAGVVTVVREVPISPAGAFYRGLTTGLYKSPASTLVEGVFNVGGAAMRDHLAALLCRQPLRRSFGTGTRFMLAFPLPE